MYDVLFYSLRAPKDKLLIVNPEKSTSTIFHSEFPKAKSLTGLSVIILEFFWVYYD